MFCFSTKTNGEHGLPLQYNNYFATFIKSALSKEFSHYLRASDERPYCLRITLRKLDKANLSYSLYLYLRADDIRPYNSNSKIAKIKKHLRYRYFWLERMTGLEPATSTLARWRSTRWATSALNWCLRAESNHRHGDFQSPALPTELQRQKLATRNGFEPSTSSVTG